MKTAGMILALLCTFTATAESPDLEKLLAEGRLTREDDRQAWADYAFHRHVTRRSLDSEGNVLLLQVMHFQVAPEVDGFDEHLLEIDGREPTAREIRHHRRKARFTKHYAESAELEIANPVGEDLDLSANLEGKEHRFVGQEEIEGIGCYRVAFDAEPEMAGGTAEDRLGRAMKGTACFSIEGLHIVEGEMVSVRPVKSGLVSLTLFRMRLEARSVGTHWLPRLIEIQSEAKVAGKTLRKWNTYRYTEYSYASAHGE